MRTVPALRGERVAGALLTRTGPAAGLFAIGIALAGAVLTPAGLWRPAVVWPIVLVVAAAAIRLGRELPSRPVPVWTAAGCGALAAGFTLWAILTRAEHMIVRRDPGSYALYTQWISTRHGLPIDPQLAAFGGPDAYRVPGFTFDAPAFYEVLHGSGEAAAAQVLPQFLIGPPAVFSLGYWTGGAVGQPWLGLQVMPPLIGGFALLAAAGATARLIGARWAPLVVAALGLCFPLLHASRASYSEPMALLVLLAATCLAIDAFDGGQGPRRARLLAVGAGLTLSLAGLVRVDAVREVALLLPCCALLAIRRHPAAAPLAAAAVAGTVISALWWVTMARPYLQTVRGSLLPLLAATAVLAVLSALAVLVGARRGRRRPGARTGEPGSEPVGQAPPGRVTAGTATAVTVAVLALGAVLASRPLWLITRQDPLDPGSRVVASLQNRYGLPIDGGRTYAEYTVQWVAWWLGWPAVVAAWVVLAVLAGRLVRWWVAGGDGADPPAWAVPLVVALGSSVLVLYRPGITPDHPWADRRLVPVILPMVVIAASAAVAWGVRVARRRAPASVFALSIVAGVGLLTVPAAVASASLATLRTEVGEPQAAAAVCRTLRPGDVVVTVDSTRDGRPQRSGNEWVQVIRGVCGHPTAALHTPRARMPQATAQLARLVAGAGGRLVLLTAQEDGARAQQVLREATGGANSTVSPRRAVRLDTVEPIRTLTRRPSTGTALVIDVWTAVLPG